MLLDTTTVLFLISIYFGLYITIFLIATLIENWGNHHSPASRRYPKVCVIVPCYNEEHTVAKTLDSLLLLDWPKAKLEIMVVDDGSTDSTYKEALKYRSKGVKVLKKRNGGKHTALNLALSKTDAEFAGALDADSTVAPDALKKVMGRFYNDDVMAVTCSMLIDTNKGFIRRIQYAEYLVGVFLRRVFADLGSQHVTPGPFTIYRKRFFDVYGEYRAAHMTEDIEVALRIQSNDYIIENATDAYVYTHGPGTWKAFYKQRLRWYYGFIANVFEYRRLFGRKHGNLGLFILPSSFFSVALLSALLVYSLGRAISQTIERIYDSYLVGFDVLRMFEWNFDKFFINTSPLMILGLISMAASLFTFLVARRFAKARDVTLSWVLFAMFYVWLYAFCWMSALAHKLLNRRVVWGHKSVVGS